MALAPSANVTTHRTAAGHAALLLAAATLLIACASDEDPTQISASGAGAFEVSLAADQERVVAAWYDTRDGNAEIYSRVVGQSSDRRLTRTAADSFVPDIALLEDSLVVAWLEKTADGRESVWLGRWSHDGDAVWQRAISAPQARGRNGFVLTTEERIFAAWIELDADDRGLVRGQWLDALGAQLSEPISLGLASDDTWNLNGTITADGRMLIAFDAGVETAANEVYLTELGAERLSTRRLTADDGFDSKYPDVVSHDGHIALSWQDERDGNTEVYVVAAAERALRTPIDAVATRITIGDGESIGAYLASAESGIALVWCDDSDGDYDVFFLGLSDEGDPQGSPRRLHGASTDSLIPAIVALGPDQFGIAWNEVERGASGYHSSDTRSEILYRVVSR